MLTGKNYVVVVDGYYGNKDERILVKRRHVVKALDEATAIARFGYRLGQTLTDLEIVSVTVKEA